MKKIGLIVLSLIVAGVIYFLTAGVSHITKEMKKELNSELSVIQTKGFKIEDRKTQEKKDHFVISFDDPNKISTFLEEKGLHIDSDDAKLLKGLKLGIDISYLADTYSAVSLDMYPLALPVSLYSVMDQDILEKINILLKNKTLLVHIDIDKLGSSFRGDIKDIDKEIKGTKVAKLVLKGSRFSGELKDKKIYHFKETLEVLNLVLGDEWNIMLDGLKSDYTMTGSTTYDYTTNYSVDRIDISTPEKNIYLLNNSTFSSNSILKDGLLTSRITSKTNKIDIIAQNKKYECTDTKFDVNVENLDIQAFQKLQQTNVQNKLDTDKLIQQLISKGVHVSIPKFSMASINFEGYKMEGFSLSSALDIDKSFNLSNVRNNPISALNSIDANINVELSRDLFNLISQQPKAMLALMLFQPKDVNGKKVYDLELKDGKFVVNGMSVF